MLLEKKMTVDLDKVMVEVQNETSILGLLMMLI